MQPIIAEPCQQDWSQMTPTAQGHYCAACNLVVRDFTRMTDAEIVAEIQAASGKVCARLRVPRSEARSRNQHQPLEIGPKAWRALQVFVVALLLSFGVSLGQEAQAQTQDILGGLALDRMPARVDSGSVAGTVNWRANGAAPEAVKNVMVELRAGGVLQAYRYTDGEGRFTFQNMRGGDYELVVTHRGKKLSLPIQALGDRERREVEVGFR
jgi:hypothetical protein